MATMAPPPPFEQLSIYGEHKRAVSSVAFAPGRVTANRSVPLCASASADGSVKIWSLEGVAASSSFGGEKNLLQPSTTLLGHSRGINQVAWSFSSQYLATASDDKTLRLWDVETSDALVEFRGHSNFVFCCQFNRTSSNLLVSGGFDETVKLWDVRTGHCVSTLPAHSDPVTGVDFNRDSTCVVSASHDGLVRVWDTATSSCLKTIYAHGNPPVSHVCYSPNGKYVLAGTLDSKLRLWSMSSSSSASERRSSNDASSSSSSSNAQNQDQDNHGGKCSKLWSSPDLVNAKYCIASGFCVSRPTTRQCIVTGSETGKVILFDINSRKVLQVLEGHSDAVLAVSSHDSQELIASGGMTLDKMVKFWKPTTTTSVVEEPSSNKKRKLEEDDDEVSK